MSSIIDDSLSNLSDLDSEHILDLSEVGEEEIATFSEAIQEVIVGVSSINGMTGDVTLTASDLNAYTKNEVNNNFATKNDIKITIDGQTFTTSQAFADMLVQELSGTFNEIFNNLDEKEVKSNKVSSISGTGDTYRYPNTKAVYDYVSPIQSNVSTLQTNVSGIQDLIPNQATTTNQLADKAFVNSSVQTATANFRGNWTTWANVPTNVNDYPADYAGSKTPTVNDYLVVQDSSDYTLDTLEGTWRFKYTGTWATDGKAGWQPEYQVNETPLTAAQLAALNSGITAGLVANIPTAQNIVITIGVDGGGNMVWSGADSISDVRTAFNNGGSLRVEAPLLTDEIYNVTEVWWKDSNHDTLIVQSLDNDAALIQIGIKNDNSVEMDNVNLQEKLQAGANISINGNVISASVPTITVDTELNNTSTNPVQNQALYDAIVGKEITFPVYASEWSEPSGTNPYTTVAIVTLPAGSFTDNCTIELMIDDKFNYFAEYGFILYGYEVSSQRLWLTALDKPTQNIYLKVRVYTYGS